MKPIYSCAAAMLMIVAGAALLRPHIMKAGPDSAATVNLAAAPAASAGQKRHLAETYGKLPLSFEANQGQTDGAVKFLSRGRGYALFLTGDEAVLTLERARQKANGKGQMAKVNAGAAPTGTLSDLVGRPENEMVAQHPLSGAAALPNLLPFPSAGREYGPGQELERPRDRRAGPALPSSSPLAEVDERSTVLRMRLLGANASAAVIGADELPGKSNYFIGNDPKKWRTNVPNYAKVKYQNVYPGVDLVYYGNQGGQLEYDFVVAPGADPIAIKLDVGAGLALPENARSARTVPDGLERVAEATERAGQAQPLRIAANGDLVVKTDGGEVRLHKPVVYQEKASGVRSHESDRYDANSNLKIVNRPLTLDNRQCLDGHYVLRGSNQVGFKVPAYDHTRPLVIDPVLSYSTYLGGSGNDNASAIAVDASGNAYVAGSTNSSDFPTVNPLQATLKVEGYNTAFVSKLNTTGSALIYSTYLGGSGGDGANGIAVDSSGNAYLTGGTGSSDFPTVNPLQAYLKGNGTAFVSKLDAAGSALVYSTYLGGSIADYGNGIAVDASGNAYVAGYTYSPDFPTVNPFQAICGGCKVGFWAAFISKLNAAGSALVYSTFLGGSFADQANAIAVDASGSAYVAGTTSSTDFPTLNPLQPRYGGNGDAFVTKLNAAGSALVYSTYLGGSGGEFGEGIAVDASGSAYVTGITSSTDFPTVNPLQPHMGGGYSYTENSFVSKLNAAGSALVYSTYLGGSDADWSRGIAVDPSGNAYVAGQTYSTDFPTVNPLQPTPQRYDSAFVSKLNAAGSALAYSTYLGGTSGNYANGIAVDTSGNAYVTGASASTNFPTVNPVQATNHNKNVYLADNDNGNAFIAKIGAADSPGVAFGPGALTFGAQNVGASSTQTLALIAAGSQPLTITDIAFAGTDCTDFTQTNTCGALPATLPGGSQCVFTVTFSPKAGGARTAALTIADNAANSPQSAEVRGGGLSSVNGVFLSSAGYHFGRVVVGTSSVAKTFSLVSDEDGPLTGISVSTTGSHDYSQTNTCQFPIAAGGSCTITITFTPTILGSDNATLVVTDSAANSPQTAVLTGAGVAAAVVMPVSTP